jgi:hypothetical protein
MNPYYPGGAGQYDAAASWGAGQGGGAGLKRPRVDEGPPRMPSHAGYQQQPVPPPPPAVTYGGAYGQPPPMGMVGGPGGGPGGYGGGMGGGPPMPPPQQQPPPPPGGPMPQLPYGQQGQGPSYNMPPQPAGPPPRPPPPPPVTPQLRGQFLRRALEVLPKETLAKLAGDIALKMGGAVFDAVYDGACLEMVRWGGGGGWWKWKVVVGLWFGGLAWGRKEWGEVQEHDGATSVLTDGLHQTSSRTTSTNTPYTHPPTHNS